MQFRAAHDQAAVVLVVTCHALELKARMWRLGETSLRTCRTRPSTCIREGLLEFLAIVACDARLCHRASHGIDTDACDRVLDGNSREIQGSVTSVGSLGVDRPGR
jgi:hypothetical protein